MHTTILFDIDHTLFDSDKYREICFSVLGERLKQKDRETFMALAEQEYKKVRLQGTFKPREFVIQIMSELGISGDIDNLSELFFDEQYIDEACYPDVFGVVESLSKKPLTTLGILSFGPDALQRKKIRSINHLLHGEFIFINELDKLRDIPLILERYKGDRLYVIDDVKAVLREFKSIHPTTVTVWIQRDPLKTDDADDFNADFKVKSLTELLAIIN